MGRIRDLAGITVLKDLRETRTVGDATFAPAIERVGLIMAAKGGLVRDITPGDCMELLDCCRQVFSDGRATRGSFLYQLLHFAGVFPPGAPGHGPDDQHPVRRAAERRAAGRPVRPGLPAGPRPARGLPARTPARHRLQDLAGLATTLALWFWKDLETHHPGIDSLRLPPDVAAGVEEAHPDQDRPDSRRRGAGRSRGETAGDILMTVRAFYLDLGQWALDEPARWGPWAVPCPVRGSDIRHRKRESQTKARMDQRTRERLPVLPVLAAAVDRDRTDAGARLDAARAAKPGELFTAGGQTLRRARLTKRLPPHLGRGPAQPGSGGT